MKTSEQTCPRCQSWITADKGMCMQCGALIEPSKEGFKLSGQICFDCGYESDSPFDACPECNTLAGVACIECGAVNPITAENCEQCGISIRSPKSISDSGDSTQPVSPDFSIFSMRPSVAGNPFAAIALALSLTVCLSISAFYISEKILKDSLLIFGLSVLPFLTLFAFLYFRKPSINASISSKGHGYSLKKEGGLVEVFSAMNPHRAEYVKELLENEGLIAIILNSHWGGFYPFANSKGVQVLVRQDQKEKALEVLDAYSISDAKYDKKSNVGNIEG